jgi:hypothetical protein
MLGLGLRGLMSTPKIKILIINNNFLLKKQKAINLQS